MALARVPYNGLMDDAASWPVSSSRFSGDRDIHSVLQEHELARLCPIDMLAADELLLKSTRAICHRYRIEFAQLSTIQRKFLTHYRCNQCGLVPLYQINLLHVKRVRCKKCGQLTAFTRKGKYGKLRKEIAFELAKEIKGNVERI